MNKNYFTQQFQRDFDKLNQAQKEAVTNIDGPMLVIAGPGTGKTQILAFRVGQILRETDAEPHEILCLTFTDAGSVAMRKRLVQFIGPTAYQVPIYTFHGFCNLIIQENMDLFGTRELQALTDLDRLEILRKLIDGFPKGHPLKRYTGETYFEIKRLVNLFNTMKQENYSPEFLQSQVDDFILNIGEYKGMVRTRNPKKGELTKKGEDKIERLNTLKAAAKEFIHYQKLLKEHGKYDYNDMILWVLEKFKSNDLLLGVFQERFQYFLVDEYQDTNGAQNDLLFALINYWDAPNVFVVGDDDQSIYRFQGASVSNILDFQQKYKPHLETVVLTNNYRSTQDILDAAKDLIDRNTERIEHNKTLLSSNDKLKNHNFLPQVYSFDTPKQELVWLAEEIEKLNKAGTNLSEVAVLYRKHKQAEELVDYFMKIDIPIQIKRKVNVLDNLFTKKIIDWLTYLSEESEIAHSREDLLFDLLHLDYFNINPMAIAQIALDIRALKLAEFKKPRVERADIYWRNYLREKEDQIEYPGVDKHDWAKIRHVLFLINGGSDIQNSKEYISLISQIKNQTPQVFFENLINDAGVLAYVMNSDNQLTLMQELTTFFDWIKAEVRRNPGIKIHDLMNTILLMQKEGIILPLIKSISQENGVNFMTVHGSKGLEFEHVYMISSDEKSWKPFKSGQNNYTFPESLKRDTAGQEQEDRRLFYVGMTRAKKALNITYSLESEDGKERTSALFVEELIVSKRVKTEHIIVEPKLLLSFEHLRLQKKIGAITDNIDEQSLRQIVEKFSMNVSNLNTYLRCPRSFYFNTILRIPSAKIAYFSFGTAVHEALELLFKSIDSGNKELPQLDKLLDYFDFAIFKERDSFTKEDYKLKKEYGKEFLPIYYEWYKDQWNLNVETEKYIRTAVGDVVITGKIDKVEFSGRQVNIVDYKTGSHDKSKKKSNFNRPGEKVYAGAKKHIAEYGGDYWRQAVFYKILVDADPNNSWDVVSTEFDFVEPDKKRNNELFKEKIVITPEDVALVKEQMKQVNRAVKQLEFDRGCEEDDCVWCNFVKDNYALTKNNPVDENVEDTQEQMQLFSLADPAD